MSSFYFPCLDPSVICINITLYFWSTPRPPVSKTLQPSKPCKLELEVTRAKCICRHQQWKKLWWHPLLLLVHNLKWKPCTAETQSHTERCAVGTAAWRCRAPLPKALLIGIKVFWWGRLLIRLERHASKMWRLFRPAQGLIDQSMAILSVYVCVCI